MRIISAILMCMAGMQCLSQEAEVQETVTQAIEQVASVEDDREPEDDGQSQWLDRHLRQKLDLNGADPDMMGEMLALTALQVRHFEQYRRLRGPFIDLMELQAVPGWDAETIRRVLPYVKLAADQHILPVLKERLLKGEHMVMLRSGRQWADGHGLKDSVVPSLGYSGDPVKLMMRYNYRFRNLLQWGVTVEKDPGEVLFRSGRGGGFDFSSWHLSLRDLKFIRALVVGDYQVSLGQGLIRWQGMAFRKTSESMLVLRQGQALRPYNGTDENRFQRGVGLQLHRRSWEGLLFLSFDRMDANITGDSLSAAGRRVSSFQTSGYHRTLSELDDKDALLQRTVGGSLRFRGSGLRISLNGIGYGFSLPLQKAPDPHNLYAIARRRWSNFSMDYGCTVRNVHFFGEAAVDQRGSKAFLNGLMASLHPSVDVSIVHRHIDPAYRALQANAFTEGSEPANERGIYAGITIRPVPSWRINGHIDLYRFPWITYRADRPSGGYSTMWHAVYKPHKKTEVSIRWQYESKEMNQQAFGANMYALTPGIRSGLRMQLSMHFGTDILLRARAEYSRHRLGLAREDGSLFLTDLLYKPMGKPFSVIARLAYFDTEGYGARIYAYENDVLFQHAVSTLFETGARCYVVFSRKVGRQWRVSCKYARTVFAENAGRTEFRMQGIWSFSDVRPAALVRRNASAFAPPRGL